MFKAAESYIKKHNVKYVWPLSGTPFTASSWSVYSYGRLLGQNWDWLKWRQTFFYERKMGDRFIPFPKDGMEEKLQEIIKKIGTVIDLKDVADVSDDIIIEEEFELNAEQKKLIRNIDDVLPISLYTKQHQLESGYLKSDGYSDEQSFKCLKDSRLLELIEDNAKIVIVCRYLGQIEKYKEMIKDRRVFVISGQEKRSASEVAKMAEEENNAVVLVQADTSDGYSLKSFDVMVFCSMSYSFVNYDQMKSRIKSMDKKHPNTYIHMITCGESVDRAVYGCVMKKQDFSASLYNK